MAETIRVRSLLPVAADGGDPVALFEKNARHPNGEAFVAGKAIVEVAETPTVAVALAEQRIEKVTETAKTKDKAEK